MRALCFIALAAAIACSGQQTPVFQSNVNLVRVDAEVAVAGKVVEGLTAAGFTIKDNGQLQQLLHFG